MEDFKITEFGWYRLRCGGAVEINDHDSDSMYQWASGSSSWTDSGVYNIHYNDSELDVVEKLTAEEAFYLINCRGLSDSEMRSKVADLYVERYGKELNDLIARTKEMTDRFMSIHESMP